MLFTSRSGKTQGFIKWATEVLFTMQMGTKDQKNEIAYNILGISAESLKCALSASTTLVSCIYRYAFGTCGELRKTMKIPDDIPDNYIVIKFGFTDNLLRRTNEHIKTYSCIKGVKLQLMNFTLIDPVYISQAEADIREFYTTIERKIEYKQYNELIAINPKHEKQINIKHKNIANEYSGCVKQLTDIISELKNNDDKMQREMIEREKIHRLEIKNIELQCRDSIREEQIKLKDEQSKLRLKEEQHKVEMLQKDLEHMKLINQLISKKK